MIFTRRNLATLAILSVITLGLYNIWLVWSWCHETNRFVGREKIPPLLVIVLGVITLGTTGCIFESLYALDIEAEAKRRGINAPEVEMSKVVVALNITAFVLTLTGVGWLLGFPIGVAATLMTQRAMNRVASELENEHLVRATTAAPFENAPT